MLPVVLAVAAVDYIALFYWFMTFVALAILVASLYRSVNPSGSHQLYAPQPYLIPGQNYFITVQNSDADIRIDFAAELLKNREYSRAAKYCYEAVEILLTSAASKLGLESSHASLSELAKKLVASGLVGLDVNSIAYIDGMKPFDGKQANEGVARRAYLIATQLRDYFRQAHLKVQK